MQTVPSSTHSWQMLPPCNAVSVLVYQTILRWCVCFALYQDHVTCILSASLDLRTCPDTLLTFYQADEDQELVKNAHHEFVCICRWWFGSISFYCWCFSTTHICCTAVFEITWWNWVVLLDFQDQVSLLKTKIVILTSPMSVRCVWPFNVSQFCSWNMRNTTLMVWIAHLRKRFEWLMNPPSCRKQISRMWVTSTAHLPTWNSVTSRRQQYGCIYSDSEHSSRSLCTIWQRTKCRMVSCTVILYRTCPWCMCWGREVQSRVSGSGLYNI